MIDIREMEFPDYITEAERKGEQNVIRFIENEMLKWEATARENARQQGLPTRRITMRINEYSHLLSILSLRFPKEKLEIIIKENESVVSDSKRMKRNE